MARHCSGNGLLLAGVIVSLVGLVVGLGATLEVPRYWMTLMVGVALLVAGAARRLVLRGTDPITRSER